MFRSKLGEAQSTPIGSVAAPTALYVDPASNNAGVAPPAAGQTYVYSIQAVNANGVSALRSWQQVTVGQ